MVNSSESPQTPARNRRCGRTSARQTQHQAQRRTLFGVRNDYNRAYEDSPIVVPTNEETISAAVRKHSSRPIFHLTTYYLTYLLPSYLDASQVIRPLIHPPIRALDEKKKDTIGHPLSLSLIISAFALTLIYSYQFM